MGIFSKKQKQDTLVLVFDIGSSSVGGVLFWTQKSGVPRIIMSLREPIALEENIDANRFLLLTTQSLNVVASKIYKAGMGAPAKIFCVLSSPWHFSQTRIISFEKNTPFVFTPTLANDLIKKEVALFEEENLAKYSNLENSVRSIELKSIKTMLNGYETEKPLDQKANKLEMTVFVSVGEESVLQKIEETIRKHFNFLNIKFCSFLLSSFAVVRDIHSHDDNFLLIDIGGEVTDIAMAKKNALRESVSFPLGFNFIIREIASSLRLSLGEARSLISLVKDEHASDSYKKKLEIEIDKLKTKWLNKFQESLANISNDVSIPATIFVSVEKDFADFFCQVIRNEQFNQYTFTESKFTVVLLGPEFFRDMATFHNDSIRDPNLTINSIYINRSFN